MSVNLLLTVSENNVTNFELRVSEKVKDAALDPLILQLSDSTHAILGQCYGRVRLSHRFFVLALHVDLGPNKQCLFGLSKC